MTSYAGWSSRQLKEAGMNVDAGPLRQMADLLAFGEKKAAELNDGLQKALTVLMPGWSGEAAAGAHAQTSDTARQAGTTADDSGAAATKAGGFADEIDQAAREVAAMAADDPPKASDYLFPWGLISPIGAGAAYLYSAQQAEGQRQALIGKITAMDSQGQQAGKTLVGSFDVGEIYSATPPPSDLPGFGGGSGTGGTGSGGAPTAAGRVPTSATSGIPAGPNRAASSAGTTSMPGSTGKVAGQSGSTVPGGTQTRLDASTGTVPQSFVPSTAAGTVTSPAPTAAVPLLGTGTAGGLSSDVGIGGALLGGALATGGASTALGSSAVGLPGTVPGGWASGSSGTAAAPETPVAGRAVRGTTGPGRVGGVPAEAPGYGVPPGGMRTGSPDQAPRRPIGRGGASGSSAGRRTGARPGVLAESPGQAGQAGGGRAGRTTGGTASGRVGGARTVTAPGASERRRDEDTALADRPDYLVESDDVWGDGRRVARAVLGQRPENEGMDT
jgi:hypothetical protein